MGRKRKYPKHKPKKKWYQKENDWGDFVFDWGLGLEAHTWREIFGISISLISIIIFFGFFGAAGIFGVQLNKLMKLLLGTVTSWVFAAGFLWFGLTLIWPKMNKIRVSHIIGFILLDLGLAGFFHLFIPGEDAKTAAMHMQGGGIIGFLVSQPLRQNLGLFVAFLILIAAIAIAVMMVLNVSIGGKEDGEDQKEPAGKVRVNQPETAPKASMLKMLSSRLKRMKKQPAEPAPAKAPVIEVDARALAKDRDWHYPPLDILTDSDDAPNPGNIQKNVEIIEKCLATFGVKVTRDEVNIGPTVTQYTFKPDEGVKLNQITARAQDLALALASKSLRIEAPIPGKNAVGFENPNVIPAKVTVKEILSAKEFKAVKSKLTIALGRGVSGTPEVVDLEKMPHLLIAGATGSGKSVCINTIITSLLFNNSPRDLRLIMVDPKRVELTNYNDIPHLLTPVITEVDQTISALKWAVAEMERRYKTFSAEGKRNITAYNQAPGPEGKMPYIVIIIDELADLMAQAANDVEGMIVRLAQMARATGMHLIVATQRPSVDVITGLIKANIPSRIAFATASQADSRTILDMSGAEKLLGNGDMLFLGNGLNKPKRMQGCWVSDPELEDLVKYLREEQEPQYDESVLQYKSSRGGGGGLSDGEADDDMYEDAVKTVVDAGKASASLLQRRLRVGYARAARLLDILEDRGVIGPADGAKPRDVLVYPGEEASFLSGSREVPRTEIGSTAVQNRLQNDHQIPREINLDDSYEGIENDYK